MGEVERLVFLELQGRDLFRWNNLFIQGFLEKRQWLIVYCVYQSTQHKAGLLYLFLLHFENVKQ